MLQPTHMTSLVVWVMVLLTGMAVEETNATDSGCGSAKLQTGMNGTISSMNFPGNYIANANCEWQITVPVGYRIHLHFNQTFRIEEASDCWKDSVLIAQQNPFSSGTYCGSEAPSDIFTHKSSAIIKFKSDATNQNSGFSVTWTAVSDDEVSGCGSPKYQTGLNGTISSMNYPKHYSGFARCTWVITVLNGSRISLHFNLPFRLESGPSCQYDNVNVYDDKARMFYGPYCDNKQPPDIISDGNVLRVNFKSDAGNNDAGFSITWTREDPKMFGPKNTYTCHCKMDVQCDVTSGVCPSKECDRNWYGEYCQTGNAALSRPAVQSSTNGSNTTAEKAVDNDRNQTMLGDSCTLTAELPLDDQPWWRVDLGDRFALLILTIYNQDYNKQLKNFIVWMTNVTDPDEAKGTVCVTYPGIVAPGAWLKLTCDSPAVGRYLYIKLLDNSTALSLCEVVVHAFQYRDCTNQQYGPNCNHRCRCANQTEQCNSASGVCISKCADDYSGRYCEKLLPYMKRVPVATTRTNTSITVTTPPWSKQSDAGDGTVLKYRLQYKAKASSQWTNSTLEHVITSTKLIWDVPRLLVNTVYQFRVVLLNNRSYEGDEKWGRPGSVMEAWTRCPDVPEPKIIEITTGIESIHVWPKRSYLLITLSNFTSDGMPSNCFKSFTVWYKASSDGSFSSNTVTKRNNYQHKFEKLKANTNYTVYIQLNNIDGKTGKSLNSIKTTAEDIPGEVRNLLATQQGKTLKVTWSEPTLKNGVITAYYVKHVLIGYGQCEDVDGSPPRESPALTTQSYTIPEELVCPYCRYNISVTAATGVGRGQPLVIMNKTTAESKPIARPSTPTAQAVISRQLTFSWANMPCKDRNGSNIGYSYQLLNGSSVRNSSVTTDLNVTFKSLDIYTAYRFRVAFTNGAGTGPYTTDVTVRTSEEAPGQVANISVEVSSSTLKILWEQPDVPNGLIKSYTVGYRLKGYGPAGQCSVTKAWTLESVAVPALEHVFKACPYCLYDTKVHALNGAGAGAEKVLSGILTNATAPTVSALEPKVDNVTTRQLEFSWTEMPCEHRNGPFVSYSCRLQLDGKDVKLDTVTSRSVAVTGLVPYMTYVFQVAYRNQAGQGPYGNAVSVVTDEDVPPAPGIVEVAASLTTISVMVVPPYPPHGVITMYTLEIWKRDTKDPGDRKSVDIRPIDHIHTFNQLTSYTSFKVKARAWTSKGAGNWSQEISIITTDSVPGPPDTIAVAKITTSSFELKWTPPKYNHGILKDYKVICALTFSYDPVVNQSKVKYSMEAEPSPDVQERIMEGLKPATKYNCSVAAQTSKGHGPSAWVMVWTEPGYITIPDRLFPDIQRDKTSDTTITVDVKKMPTSFKNGLVRAVRIGVKKLGNSRRKRSTPLTTEEHSQMLDYETAKNSGYMSYIAAELNSTYTGEFIIGDGKTYDGYHNPPLETGQKYDVIFGIVITAGRATTTSYSRRGEAIIVVGGKSAPAPAFSVDIMVVGLAVGVPVTVLAIIIPIVVVIRKRRGRQAERNEIALQDNSALRSDPPTSTQMEETNTVKAPDFHMLPGSGSSTDAEEDAYASVDDNQTKESDTNSCTVNEPHFNHRFDVPDGGADTKNSGCDEVYVEDELRYVNLSSEDDNYLLPKNTKHQAISEENVYRDVYDHRKNHEGHKNRGFDNDEKI